MEGGGSFYSQNVYNLFAALCLFLLRVYGKLPFTKFKEIPP